jgi:RNA polymerase sigma factor (sigma-70 family)
MLVRYLHRAVGPSAVGGLSDAQLVQRWAERRDEAAFEVLVWRHGPMVLNVSRRVLRAEHDVEDAFQATFLTLVRKAGTIGKQASVGSWLYKVAFRIACEARARAARRAARERTLGGEEAVAMLPPDPDDCQPVLDDEINCLPSRYRLPVVLCYLEGKTTDEAARQLGCPRGTIATRLAWARERLRSRLVRRGLTVSAVCVATALTSARATAALAAPWVARTVLAATQFAAGQTAAAGGFSAGAVALTQGVLKAMWMTRLKLAAVLCLFVAAAGSGLGVLARQALADRPTDTSQAEAARPEANDPAPGARTVADPVAQDQGGKGKEVGGKKERDEPGLKGVLQSVDPAKRIINVKVMRDGGEIQDHELAVAKDASVSVPGKEKAALTDLKAGMRVAVGLSADRKTAVRIRVDAGKQAKQKNTVSGIFRSADAVKNTITVSVAGPREGQTQDQTFSLARDVAITTAKGAGRLADLQPGMRILLRLSADRSVVISIETVRGDG